MTSTMATDNLTIDDLAERFEFLTDWEDRFSYLIDLGRKLPEMPAGEQTKENLVKGCQATVYLKAHVPTDDDAPHIELHATSNAAIVNGLIAILLCMYSGRTAEEILTIDAEGFITRMGFEDHLTSTRKNGMYAMIKRIRGIATAYATAV